MLSLTIHYLMQLIHFLLFFDDMHLFGAIFETSQNYSDLLLLQLKLTLKASC